MSYSYDDYYFNVTADVNKIQEVEDYLEENFGDLVTVEEKASYYIYVDGQIVGEYSTDIIDDPNRYATLMKRLFSKYGHKPEAKPHFEINVWCEDQDTFFMLCDYMDQLDNDPNILVIDMPR